MKKKYLVIYEWSGKNYGVYSPDVPGCVSTGATLEEAERNYKEALQFHLEVGIEYGESIPEPVSQAGYVEIEIADPIADTMD